MTSVSVHKVKPARSAIGSTPSWLAAPQRFGVLQRRIHGQSELASVPPIVHEVLNSPGQPLDAATRAYMEPRFGHDFSKVRVHADGKAAAAASAINARAFTSGRSIAFGGGQYGPQTQRGRRLLAHELTHVVQQGAGSWRGGQEHDEYERNADAMAEQVVQSRSVRQFLGGDLRAGTVGLAGVAPCGSALQKKSMEEQRQPKDQGMAQSVEMNETLAPDDSALDDLEKEIRKRLKEAHPGVVGDMMVIEQEMAAKQADFKKKNIDDIVHEIEMRYFVVQVMHFVDDAGMGRFRFPDANRRFMINNTHWEALGEAIFPGHLEYGYVSPLFSPKYEAVGSSAAAAMESIFAANAKNPVVLDCNAMMVAMQYEAMRRTFGNEKFNEMFPSDKRGLFVGPAGDPGKQAYPPYESSKSTGTEDHPFLQLDLYTLTPYTAAAPFDDAKVRSELVTGDWVYFQNHEDYDRCSPYGLWYGEHAMYVGDGKFRGFGLGTALTYDGFLRELQSRYETACGISADPALTTKNMPGIIYRLTPNTRKMQNLPKVEQK